MDMEEEVCFSDDEDKKELCSICFGEMTSEDSHTLEECDHRFHTKCILKWFRSKQDTCPLCRLHPLVKLKVPDVFHRAKTLIQKQRDGLTSDSFVQDKMEVISESERMKLIYEKDLQQHKEIFKNVTKPRKEDLLRQYRILRKQFKDKSSPILKQLDEIDEKEQAVRRRLRNSITQEQKKKRQAMRDIGLHNIETQSIPTRVYYDIDNTPHTPRNATFSFAAHSPTFSES